MPEIRQDPLSSRWVIFAEDRERRPNEYRLARHHRHASQCPFCAGHEADTPPPIAQYGRDGRQALGPVQTHEDWLVRVVPNKFPALVGHDHAADDAERTRPVPPCHPGRPRDLYQQRPAIGSHEVVVESPRHVASLTELSHDEAMLTLRAYRDRLRHLRQVHTLRYALVFKNVGPAAGASLEHAHSQIAATPILPVELQRELSAAETSYAMHGECLFCRMLEQELAEERRLVATSADGIAFCPFASRTPYETWVLPRQHASHFEDQSLEQLADLARFLPQVLERLERLHPRLAYNFFLHTAPFDTLPLHHYHWHIEIIPRLTTAAGFEWGTGLFINPVLPENAARTLRD
jgi:UDPglucose--hexose-1-phosphate uridylyltransferase